MKSQFYTGMKRTQIPLFIKHRILRFLFLHSRFIPFLLISNFLILSSVFSQTNYEPVSSSVYSFLERLSGKGMIQLNEEIQPFSRLYIAQKMIEIKSKKLEVKSELEEEELKFYIREYSSELNKLGFDLSDYHGKGKLFDLGTDRFGFDHFNRFRFFSYDTDEFGIFVDPVLSFNYNSHNDGSWWRYSNGINLHGFLGENIGFDLRWYDNHLRGEVVDPQNRFTKETGYEFSNNRQSANLNFSWKSVTLSLSKDYNYYGTGEDGKLILSDKAPAFPNLKLEVFPTEFLRFSYILGNLNSQVLDLSTIRYNPYRNHISTVSKYLVAHMLSITPFKFLNLSVGESVIFSDRFEPIYLIPIAFFRIADYYLIDPDDNAGNAQVFSSFWYKNYWLKTKIYGSIFIDEINLSRSNQPEAVGYNIGFKSIDPLIPESEFVFEYTRINPFVYFHADSAQTYWNTGYEMGHWIGSNADELYVSFRKRILRGLNIDLWYRYIRKGNEEDFEEPRYQDSHKFLWGNKIYYTYYGAKVNYEIAHGFNTNITYNYIKTTSDNREDTSTSTLKFALQYGI